MFSISSDVMVSVMRSSSLVVHALSCAAICRAFSKARLFCPYDQAALERWADVPEAGHAPIESRVLSGHMEQFLVSAADREACDWLVLGLQGRTALAALLMGSTTDRVLKLADRPVLVIPMTSPLSGKPTN
jgi:hypothetical protein